MKTSKFQAFLFAILISALSMTSCAKENGIVKPVTIEAERPTIIYDGEGEEKKLKFVVDESTRVGNEIPTKVQDMTGEN